MQFLFCGHSKASYRIWTKLWTCLSRKKFKLKWISLFAFSIKWFGLVLKMVEPDWLVWFVPTRGTPNEITFIFLVWRYIVFFLFFVRCSTFLFFFFIFFFYFQSFLFVWEINYVLFFAISEGAIGLYYSICLSEWISTVCIELFYLCFLGMIHLLE